MPDLAGFDLSMLNERSVPGLQQDTVPAKYVYFTVAWDTQMTENGDELLSIFFHD